MGSSWRLPTARSAWLTPPQPDQRGRGIATVHLPVVQVRGRGLLDAIVIKDVEGVSAYDVCMKLKEAGLLVSAAVSCSP